MSVVVSQYPKSYLTKGIEIFLSGNTTSTFSAKGAHTTTSASPLVKLTPNERL